MANADALDTSAAHPHQTNYAYDGFDRLILTLYADGSGDQAAYDANGNALTRTNRAGEIVSFAYDALNRVVSKALPVSGSIAADTVSWAYDLAGRIVSLSGTAGQALTNSYDSAGRIVSTAAALPGLAGAKTVSYAYDAASNRTKLTWPDGYNASYAYDAANRMLSAVENGVTALASFDYDNLGHPAWEQYAGTGAKVSFSWSNEGDLLTLSHALQGTAAVSFTDGYTPAHQIASSSIGNGLYQYVPQDVPQVSGTDSYAANALNQYASVTPAGGALTSIGYDLKGNLASDGTFAFAYDAENKLMTAAKTGTSAAYAYDPLGRRDVKTVNGTSTYFLSADADEIAEYDNAGTLLRRYVPGPAIDRPVAMVDAAGTRTFFHQDKTGSVIAMSDASGNKTEGPYLYDSYGNGAPYTGVPFKYTGRRLDPETGLYYYRARYYTSALGRFLQTDAIGYADDIDWYTYVQNDPTDKTDPTGDIGIAASFDEFLATSNGQLGSVGVAISFDDGKLQVGGFETHGQIIVGVGGGASAGLSVIPKDVQSLAGPSLTAVGGVGSVSASGSVSITKDSQGKEHIGPVNVGSLTHSKFFKLGEGATAGGAVARTDTKVSGISVDVGGAVQKAGEVAGAIAKAVNTAKQIVNTLKNFPNIKPSVSDCKIGTGPSPCR